MGELEGKVAIVLGASAEGGTGWAVAEELARRGAKVAVAARNRDRVDQLAAKIAGLAFTCDIALRESMQLSTVPWRSWGRSILR
jgi:NAD(P)-dependent dehydrogenase (short-subunit alcohol dehydrogenase family)